MQDHARPTLRALALLDSKFLKRHGGEAEGSDLRLEARMQMRSTPDLIGSRNFQSNQVTSLLGAIV